jgi:serine/threonine protein kinase/Tfp pilus assembly protein PilF
MTASAAASQPSAPTDKSFADLVEDLTTRLHSGEIVDLDAFLNEHVEHAERLGRLLPALRLLADVSRSRPDGLLAPGSVDSETLAGTLGDFQIIREVGRGGMGVVYEAEQLSLGRRVALKVLPFAATMDPRHLHRFQNEARAAASLEHPHIVPVYGVGCERGVHYYAMKFIDGESLAVLLESQRQTSKPQQSNQPRPHGSGELPQTPQGRESSSTSPRAAFSTQLAQRDAATFRQIAEWGIQAAEGLEHAHSIGIVHRDIKPANIMIDGHSSLWVTDFGLARTAADAGLTMTGDVLGTLRYMSPEQALAKHGLVDHRTDVYSLGVTLYELVTGTPAIGGRDREEILNAITLEEPRSPRSLDSAIPPDLETIVLKAMAKNAGERYSMAGELAEDLRRFLEIRPIVARQPSRVQKARKWAQRHRAWVTAASLVLLVTTVAAITSSVLIYRAYQQETAQRHMAEEKESEAIAAVAAEEKAKQEALIRESESEAVVDFLENKIFAAARPKGEDGGIDREVSLRQAIDGALPFVEKSFKKQPLIEARLRTTLGTSYRHLSQPKLGVEQFKIARALYTQHRGPEHPDTIVSMHNLANAYEGAGRHTDALMLREQTLALRRAKLGPEHPDTLSSMNNLANSYAALGRDADSLKLREETLAMKKAKLGPDHPSTLMEMNNLANNYERFGRVADALKLREATVALKKAKLGPDHSSTLTSMHNLANSYENYGRSAKALKLHEHILTVRKARFGPEHASTIITINALARCYARVGRYAEAAKLLEDALALDKTKSGANRPESFGTMESLASFLADCPDARYRNVARAVELAKRALNDTDHAAKGRWNTYGVAVCRAGKWKDAISALEKSIELRHGGDSFDWFFLAMSHSQEGHKEEARKWYDKAVAWMEKNMPQNEELRRSRAEAAELLGVKELPAQKATLQLSPNKP